jgi:hypothetical protein
MLTRWLRQHADAEGLEVSAPLARARVVLVVAGGRSRRRGGCADRRAGRRAWAQLLDAAVDEIAADGDHVGRERVDVGDDLLEPGAPESRLSHVHVADERDGGAVERGRQAAQRELERLHPHAGEGGAQARAGGRPDRARR